MSSSEPRLLTNQRLSYKQKNKNGKQWYKDQADALDTQGSYTMYGGNNGITEYKRKKVNYDLYNNILDLSDFEYVCQPFGAEAGELPAQMVNRDISSPRIKAVLGLEMKRPFSWRAIATNKEATTRKENEEFTRIRDFVLGEIMQPVKVSVEQKYKEQIQGRELQPEEQEQLQQQIAEEIKSQTPEEVKKYMERDHQDPAEVLASQILNYLMQKEEVKRKFNKGWKHAALSAEEIYWVGILNGKPKMKVINPLRFSYDKSPDVEFIEDGEWATYEYRLHPSEIVKYFGDQLTDTEIDEIYEHANDRVTSIYAEDLFSNSEDNGPEFDHNTNRVLHTVWKSLRKLGFLTYKDEDNVTQQMIVGEDYEFDEENGDISLEWEWVPETYETYKIDNDKYVHMRPVPGQFKDINNLYECKLPYIGAVYDNLNSQPTSLMDRMKVYQYYYNIVMYRLELLMASDKGKKVLMNINAIPTDAGIDVEKWQYFFESTGMMWYNPNEEGANYADANTISKSIDLSMASDIGKYIELANFLEEKCGKSVGITDTTLGDISPSQEVGNTRQAIVQTSHILEPYFDLHNHVKKNVLQALIETGKIAYSNNPSDALTYTLDDMSLHTVNMDIGLLDSSTLGIFISDGSVDEEVKENIRQFAHAALQNQMAELSDVIKIIRSKNSQSSEEILEAAEKTRQEREDKATEQQQAHEQDLAERTRQEAEREHERKKELIILEEEEKRKTDIQKQTILSLGFNEDKDLDKDGMPDVLEVAKHGVDTEIKQRKQDLEEKKFQQSKKEHSDKMKVAKANNTKVK